MIKVEDSTLVDFERHRKILIDGSEKEIDRLTSILRGIEQLSQVQRDLSKANQQILHDFVHSARICLLLVGLKGVNPAAL
jgi:hypothetical protein